MIKNSFYFGSIAFAVLASGAVAAQEINLYTTREPGLMQPLLDAFTEETGIEVNSIFVQDGLAERVAAEGQRSPADVLMTVDFGRLIDLVEQGLTQSTDSAVLNSVVPANLRGDNGHWYALSMRARVVYAAKDLGIDSITYEELADERWRGAFCIRSGQHPYNTALFGAHIAHHGEAAGRRRQGGRGRRIRDVLQQAVTATLRATSWAASASLVSPIPITSASCAVAAAVRIKSSGAQRSRSFYRRSRMVVRM